MLIKAGIIITSDKGACGNRIDRSGPAIRKILEERNFSIVGYQIIPDEKETIKKTLIQFSENVKCDLIITSGGTGLSPRDVTPEATQEIIDRVVPGFAEAMRIKSLDSTPYAMISRGICGIYQETLILNLPGSPKGAVECLTIVLPAIPHALDKLKGDQSDCEINHGL